MRMSNLDQHDRLLIPYSLFRKPVGESTPMDQQVRHRQHQVIEYPGGNSTALDVQRQVGLPDGYSRPAR